MDTFAQIAKSGIQGRQELLHTPQPMAVTCPVQSLSPCCRVPDTIPAKMQTPTQLQQALEQARQQYAPFLQDHAPQLPCHRKTTLLKEFLWKKEQDSDWQTVSIPHYGGPLGAATTYYKTEFSAEPLTKAQRLFLVVNGADYKARIYVNNRFVGMHEGFFASFEFDISKFVQVGQNTLTIELENDYVMLGNSSEENPQTLFGDKIYAATGPGYDDPIRGWHHCPPGMGLLDTVELQVRSAVFVQSVFPRVQKEEIEFWVEIGSCLYEPQHISFLASIYGQNCDDVIVENMHITPSTGKEIGMGDTFTEVLAKREGSLKAQLPLPCGKGRNLYKFRIDSGKFRFWSPEEPWLYQLQLRLLDSNGTEIDTYAQSFGNRTFTQDTDSLPKGRFYLNGEEIRLFGANTMGFEQQDVMTGNDSQLIDDILLAKLCNMNFWRITQRPVQQKIYDFCDRLGLLVQTDLPLFSCLRRHQFCEAVRQAEEMERHIRSHSCCILVSYINEPFPNASNLPNINLERPELEQFFAAADIVVKLNNPDRVIKHIDGDYDPPSETMPDNHCYPMWYNGHGIDIGKLHKGYWMPVLPDWCYGCGEFGCEGLEDWSLMQERYPKDWLVQPDESPSDWNPNRIIRAQTADFYHFFYNKPKSPTDWVYQSQKFQALATRMMTEAFRRDNRMVSFAIHLFIDAFPSGWMKTIMDCKRNPKPAFFAYQQALEPVLVSLRTDKHCFFSDETAFAEGWICNSTGLNGNFTLKYELIAGDTVIQSGEYPVALKAHQALCYSSIDFVTPHVTKRTNLMLRAILSDGHSCISWNEIPYTVFPPCPKSVPMLRRTIDAVTDKDLQAVKEGAVLWIDKPCDGNYSIANSNIQVKESGMSPMHFASSNTGHKWVEGFVQEDFLHWYCSERDRIFPLADCTVQAEGFSSVLSSRNINKDGKWQDEALLCEKNYGKGRIVLSQISYAQMMDNPAGCILISRITPQ